MRKYTRPEMECRVFASENVVTSSKPAPTETPYTSSMDQLREKYGDHRPNYVERDWNNMGS